MGFAGPLLACGVKNHRRMVPAPQGRREGVEQALVVLLKGLNGNRFLLLVDKGLWKMESGSFPLGLAGGYMGCSPDPASYQQAGGSKLLGSASYSEAANRAQRC